MKLNVLILSSFSVIGGVLAQTSPLDAPGEKNITVGSEILRGVSEISATIEGMSQAQKIRNIDLNQLELTLRAVLQRNRDANTDTDGFMLGARLEELWHFDIRLRLPEAIFNDFNDPENITAAAKFARFCYSEIRRLQSKLALDDAGMLTAAKFTQNPQTEAKMRAILTSY